METADIHHIDLNALQTSFTHILLERMDRSANVNRFYYLAWQPTLFEQGAVVRYYGRRDGPRRTLAPVPLASLAEAWPWIRSILRQRLRHGYQVVTAPLLLPHIPRDAIDEQQMVRSPND